MASNFEAISCAHFHLQERELAFVTGRHMRYKEIGHGFEVEDVVDLVRLNFKGHLELEKLMAWCVVQNRIGNSTLAVIAIAIVVMAAGCAIRQPPLQTGAAMPARPLPFTGHLRNGNPKQVPPAVAMSLVPDSPVTFLYREELTHDEYHTPMIVSALDPVTLFGAPLGDFGVTAFASLSILDGDRVLADYTAKAYVTRSYSLYSQPTHRALEQAARVAVREKIDRKLYRNEDRIAQAIARGDAAVSNVR
ncbi:MAG: hypothetical protein ACREQ4_18065 [Candidatus Binataceae bacterium]